jgi:hypothetical protein
MTSTDGRFLICPADDDVSTSAPKICRDKLVKFSLLATGPFRWRRIDWIDIWDDLRLCALDWVQSARQVVFRLMLSHLCFCHFHG